MDLVQLALVLLPDAAQGIVEPAREVLHLRRGLAQRYLVLARAVVRRGVRAPIRPSTRPSTRARPPRRRRLLPGVRLVAYPAVLPHRVPRVRPARDVRDLLAPDARSLLATASPVAPAREWQETTPTTARHGTGVMRVARSGSWSLAGVLRCAPPPKVDGHGGDAR